jgi:hypothetical protein
MEWQTKSIFWQTFLSIKLREKLLEYFSKKKFIEPLLCVSLSDTLKLLVIADVIQTYLLNN